jgi:hypothetical protein
MTRSEYATQQAYAESLERDTVRLRREAGNGKRRYRRYRLTGLLMFSIFVLLVLFIETGPPALPMLFVSGIRALVQSLI